jgi:hypothetical protein
MTPFRASLPLVLVALLAACKPDDKPKTNPDTGNGGKTTPPVKQQAESPPGGIAMIQDAHDDLVEELKKQEALKQSGEGVDTRLLQNQIKLVENLITACEIAVRNEAEHIVRRRYAQMKTDFGRMYAELAELGKEIREVEGILEDAKGGGRIPEGFTEDELRDRLDDLKKTVERKRTEIEEFKDELRKYEDVIASGNFQPPADGTVFTKELEALRKTRDRAKALLPE